MIKVCPNSQNCRDSNLLIKRLLYTVLFWSLLVCTSCFDAAAQDTEECPVMTATLDNCEVSFLFVRYANGTLWNGGFNGKTFSGCYDKNECYIIEAGYAMQDCRLQVVMNETEVLRRSLSSDNQLIKKSIFFIGECDIRCPEETALLLTNVSPVATKDIEFSFHTLNKGYAEGIIRHGEMVTFCIDLEACNLLYGSNYANYYLLQNNKLIEEKLKKNEDENAWSGTIMLGNCMKSCPDLKVILSTTPDQSYSYVLKEDGYLLEKGNVVAGDHKEFCLNSNKCNQLDGSGNAMYIAMKDGLAISHEQSIDHRLIGACKNICDDKPLLSSTRRSVDIFSVISSVSTSGDLIDTENKRYEAICWLIYDDTKQLEATDPFLIQRYVLALFYLSTNGSNWYFNFGYMTAGNECSWAGITCVDGYVTEFNYGK